MNLRPILTGIFASALLLVVLAISRLYTVESSVPDLQVREIETVTIQPPPPPPPMEEQPPDAPPPPPALTDITPLPDASRIPVPRAQVPMDITAPVEDFFTDLEPAPLPTPPKPVVRSSRSSSKQYFKKESNYKPTVRAKPAPVVKSIYSSSELDGTPRLLRHGSARFPSSLSRKGITRGTVVLEVELSTSGSVSIRKVISATNQELVSAARRVASGARFTAPKKNGTSVKAIMRWPIVIQK